MRRAGCWFDYVPIGWIRQVQPKILMDNAHVFGHAVGYFDAYNAKFYPLAELYKALDHDPSFIRIPEFTIAI